MTEWRKRDYKKLQGLILLESFREDKRGRVELNREVVKIEKMPNFRENDHFVVLVNGEEIFESVSWENAKMAFVGAYRALEYVEASHRKGK